MTKKTATKRAQQKKPVPAKKTAAKRAAKPKAARKAVTPENREKAGPYVPVPPIEHRFQPGQSGNPAGRPRVKPLTDAYRSLLGKKVEGDAKGRTYAELIAEATLHKALKGDLRALQEITDRAEGKATQPISGPDEGPVQFESIGKMTPEERDEAAKALAIRLGLAT